MSSTTGVFSAPDLDMVPYDVEALNADGSPYTLSSTQVLALVSSTAGCIVVPNSNDPTGATGNLVAASGFSGAVNGTGTFTDSADPTAALSVSWTGTFVPGTTEPASLSVVFGSPTPPASSKRSAR